jgi:hypothetical protein
VKKDFLGDFFLKDNNGFIAVLHRSRAGQTAELLWLALLDAAHEFFLLSLFLGQVASYFVGKDDHFNFEVFSLCQNVLLEWIFDDAELEFEVNFLSFALKHDLDIFFLGTCWQSEHEDGKVTWSDHINICGDLCLSAAIEESLIDEEPDDGECEHHVQ